MIIYFAVILFIFMIITLCASVLTNLSTYSWIKGVHMASEL